MPIFASNFSSNSLSGTATVVAGNVTINLTPAAFALEGDRTFVVKLRKGSSQAAVIATSPVVTIKDRTTFVSLTANTATVAEGNLVAFSLVTTNVLNGATVYYSVLPATANVTADDFTANTGSAVITNNAATFALQANADISLSNEDGETFKVQLRTNSPTGNIVFATSNIEILDTYKTYNVLSFAAGSASPIVSGSNVTFTFTATNVPSGTLLYYSTTGNVTSFSSNTGSFAMNSTSNTIVITNPQAPFAASRAYNVLVRSGSASGPILTTSSAMVVMDDSILPLFGTGGTQTTANGYTINYFTTSGNITFNKAGTVEYVAISGGGGGYGGGGGSGKVADHTTNGSKTVVAGNVYTVTIGAGGTASGGAGGSTVFDTLTLAGGNGGAFGDFQSGGAGGASAQPFAGGAGAVNAVMGLGGAGGGGGGAGSTGTAAVGSGSNDNPTGGSPIQGGAGGSGITSISIDGNSRLYAGGGGGGSYSGRRALGGSGGGGNGEAQGSYNGNYGTATFTVGTSGNVNTGSGGGGHGGGSNSYAGGSGIVIVRYTTPAVTFANITTPTAFTYEGSNAVFTLSTTNVSNNTLLYYYTVGNILSSHFVTGNTGSFRTTLNSTTITLQSNTTIPANEERIFQLIIAGDAGTSQDPLITSNVFTVKDSNLQPKTSSIEYLVVAGGGGGGGQNGGGGGGAGGYLANSAYPITPSTPYTITVGGGGAGAPGSQPPSYTNSIRGGVGGNSSIGAGVVSFGGGGGGTFYGAPLYNTGEPGGSGGAGHFSNETNDSSQPKVGLAIGSPGWNVAGSQGYPSGRSSQNVGPSAGKAGGGGGAGQTGSDGPSSKGGDGLQTSISGSATYYGGGGGGAGQSGVGAGGLGGGGSGPQGPGSSGSINTGGGGGGMGTDAPTGFSGSGGSGIVIIRYPDTFATATTTGSPNVIYANANIIYRFWQTGSITFP